MKWILVAAALLIGALVIYNIIQPNESLEQIRASRDSAKADRLAAINVAESLAIAAAESKKAIDSLKAIKTKADTVIIRRIKYLAPKVAHADSVAPNDTIWKPIAFEVMDQRDSLLANSLRADTIIDKQNKTIAFQDESIKWYSNYKDRAERRIGQLEEWQEDKVKSFKLFGKIPLPQIQVTAGMSTELKPALVAGLGYTVKFGRKRPPPPEYRAFP